MRRFMRRLKKSFRYGEKGFTLIELLIVILILGVLAAVVVPNAARFLQSGKKGAAESELGSVQVAVYAAMADAGAGTIAADTIPPDLSDYPIDEYLQGGIARLKGSWTVHTTGLVIGGKFEDAAASAFWTYSLTATGTPGETPITDGTGIPTWEYTP